MNLKQSILILVLVLSVSAKALNLEESRSTTESSDYVQIILYGQSLGMGWECKRAISTNALPGNYMIGDNVNMQYNNGAKILSPLVATRWNSGGEQPIVSCVNAFSFEYKQSINLSQKFIGMTAGHGGQTIERLSKECTNEGYYNSTFIKTLDNTLAAIAGKTVTCPAILFVQGEYNSNKNGGKGKGMTPGTNGTTNKEVYKDLLMKLKNNMQADIMQKYKQAEKPIFFVYQTSGKYIGFKEMAIVMAQIEFANENEDVVLMNPHYALPDYSNGHLSTNGYRWFGQYMAKALIHVLIHKTDYQTLKPIEFDFSEKKISIKYSTPVTPLVFDTLLTPKQTNYGFCVYKNGVSQTIKKIEITDSTTVEITCSSDLVGKIEVVYAGNTTNGSGNLRDSDPAQSLYTYFDDSADTKKEDYTPVISNSSIYGKQYPLQNWADMFYHTFDVAASTGTQQIALETTKAFPNPAKDYINIRWNNTSENTDLFVYNSLGETVHRQEIISGENSLVLRTESYVSGQYFYRFKSKGNVTHQSKFIVIKN